VHSHSHSIVPISISVHHRLRAVSHMAGIIGAEAPLFEICDTGGAGRPYGVKISFAAEYEPPGIGPPEITYMRPAWTAAPNPWRGVGMRA
jgi:hypothetical protein